MKIVTGNRFVAGSAAILSIAALGAYFLASPVQPVLAGLDKQCLVPNSTPASPGQTQTCVYTENGKTIHGTQYCQADGTWSQCV
jgi:hypothetical protein